MNTQVNKPSPDPPSLPSGCHGYLAIEGLIALADLLPLPVAPGSDQLQYGLLVAAWKKGEHPSPYANLPPGSPTGLLLAVTGISLLLMRWWHGGSICGDLPGPTERDHSTRGI